MGSAKYSRHFFTAFLLLIICNVGISSTIDSLLKLRTQHIKSSDKVSLLESNLALCEEYMDEQEYSKLLAIGEESLLLVDELEAEDLRAKTYYYIGYAHDWLSEYNKALKFYNLGVEALEKIQSDDLELKGGLHSRIAQAFKSKGNYDDAYNNEIIALKVAESLNDSIKMSTSLYQIGSIFYYQKHFDNALEYYQKAEVYSVCKGGERMAYNCVAAMGSTYEALGQVEKSLEFNIRSLEIANQINYKTGRAYSLSNVGSTYMTMEKYDKAYNYLIESLVLKREIEDKWGEVGTLRTLADNAIKSNNPEQAIKYLEEAYPIAIEKGMKPRQIEILEYFSKAYKKLGQFEKAMEYLENYITLKDEILNETTLEKMGEMKKNYEVFRRDNEIMLLQKSKEVLAAEQEKGRLIKYLWTGAAIFFCIVMVLFISRYKAQKRSSILLEEKNNKINLQNDELQKFNDLLSGTNLILENNKKKIEEQNKALESSNEDLRNFASVASHDLKEPLRMINSYTSFLKKKYEGLFDERAHEFMGYVVDGVSRMEQMINSLLDYSRVSINGGQENYKLINSASIVDIVQGNLRYPIIQHGATVHVENYENFPIIRGHQMQMMQLVQNLVSNALKFKGDRAPVVTIGFTTKDTFHTFYVKDNGIGISKENQQKVFDMLTRLHTKQEYEGTGIGLATVRKIVERHGGKIWVESEEGKGSTFYYSIPVVKEAEPALV